MKTLEEITMEAIAERLKHFNGNIKDTANSLGIGESSIYRYISQGKLTKPVNVTQHEKIG